METQNVSSQLFTKQLKPGERAGSSGCKESIDNKFFTTCINDSDSDVAIENAFQKQLDLTEYYKGPAVFDAMKKNYMDQTLDYPEAPVVKPVARIPPPVSVTPMTTVGPTDFLNKSIKESFGKREMLLWEKLLIALMAVLLILMIVFVIYINK